MEIKARDDATMITLAPAGYTWFTLGPKINV
jgi:hypothetical protein